MHALLILILLPFAIWPLLILRAVKPRAARRKLNDPGTKNTKTSSFGFRVSRFAPEPSPTSRDTSYHRILNN